MAVQNIAALKSDNDAKIYDNTTEDVTGTILHDLLRDILDSSINRETDPFVMSNVILVDPDNGNNGTGRRGDLFRRFLTIAAAQAVAIPGDVIKIIPGVHVTAGGLGVDGIIYDAMPGAQISATTTIFGGTGISYQVKGNGRFLATNGWIVFSTGCTISFEADFARANSTSAGIYHASGGKHDIYIREYFSNYDGFNMDNTTDFIGGDYMNVRAEKGRTNHTGFYQVTVGGQDCTLKAYVTLHTVGWTALGGGWGTFNVGGRIEFYGNMIREDSVSDESGAWHYAHGIAPTGASTLFSGKTSLLCTDGANPSEMRYGFRNDSANDFTFELSEGAYLHSHSYLDATSTPIYWSSDTVGALLLYGTLDQNGDSGSSGNCIRFMNATMWPTVEFRGCDLKQTGGYAADTVYLNAGATTYIGKLLYRDGAFPGTFTNSITGLEVDY